MVLGVGPCGKMPTCCCPTFPPVGCVCCCRGGWGEGLWTQAAHALAPTPYPLSLAPLTHCPPPPPPPHTRRCPPRWPAASTWCPPTWPTASRPLPMPMTTRASLRVTSASPNPQRREAAAAENDKGRQREGWGGVGGGAGGRGFAIEGGCGGVYSMPHMYLAMPYSKFSYPLHVLGNIRGLCGEHDWAPPLRFSVSAVPFG
jgi:hypothetical protein